MTRLIFFTMLLWLSFSGLADTVRARHQGSSEGRGAVPNLDVNAGCRDVASNDLNRTSDYPGCIAEERTARQQLEKEWASYSAADHDQCMNLVTPPALPSYVTLQECLKMARDAQNMTKSGGASQIGKTMQAPSKD